MQAPRIPAGLGPQALALAIGALGGALAFLIGMPLPWMLGAMAATTAAAMGRLPVAAPQRLRPLVIPIIGVLLGSSVTPEVVAGIVRWGPSMAVLPVFLAAAAAASATVYRRLGGYDLATAYYSAMPGGLAEMIVSGTAAGGDDRRIALAHALRIFLVISCIGLWFGLVLGVTARGAGGARVVPLSALGLGDAAWLIGAGIVGVPLGRLLRLPAGNMIGPMLVSSGLHLSGLVTVPPPSVIVSAAQIVLGTVVGCRFLGMRLAEVRADIALAFVSTLSMLATTAAFAELVHQLTGIGMAQSFLAYAPGGLTEMSLIAIAMGQEVAFVAVTHIVRIFLIVLGGPLAWRLFHRT